MARGLELGVENKLRRLPPSGELGYPLERLEIFSVRQGTDVSVTAYGFYLEPEFLVLRDSQALVQAALAVDRPADRDARKLRNSLVEDGTLIQRGTGRYVFVRDYVFHSVSLAASVILGRSVSGAEEWHGIDGTKLADLLAEPVPA